MESVPFLRDSNKECSIHDSATQRLNQKTHSSTSDYVMHILCLITHAFHHKFILYLNDICNNNTTPVYCLHAIAT